jgi:two-component system, sensor histidine kinase ChiS
MLMTQTALRTCLDNTSMALDKALSSINLTLFKNVQERMKDFRNLSLSILRFQDGFVDICGQHESILLLPADSDEVEVVSTMDLGIYIGLIDDISEHVSTKRIKLGKGDMMILYSDGITEAENSNGQLYGLEPVMDVLLQNRFLSSRELGEKILTEVYNFIGTATMFDDISLIVIKYK